LRQVGHQRFGIKLAHEACEHIIRLFRQIGKNFGESGSVLLLVGFFFLYGPVSSFFMLGYRSKSPHE